MGVFMEFSRGFAVNALITILKCSTNMHCFSQSTQVERARKPALRELWNSRIRDGGGGMRYGTRLIWVPGQEGLEATPR